MAIVRSILAAEKRSHLFFYPEVVKTFAFTKLKETWYVPFFQLLTENCERKDLEERFKSIALIIFNYDRCVEHYLYYALQNYYGISEKESAELVRNIKIYHPYGKVGALPWWTESDSIGFGSEPNPEQLLKLTSQIKTFTEGIDPESSEIEAIRHYMANADRLVFLGFAFHKLNMGLIDPNAMTKLPKCYATTYGISESDQEVISEQIMGFYHIDINQENLHNIKMSNDTCSKFFAEFWKGLAF